MTDPTPLKPLAKPPVFLVESPHPWWGVWQRPHQIVSRLAWHFPVYYVTPLYLRNLRGHRADFKRCRELADADHNGVQVRALTQWHGERFGPILRRNQSAVTRAFRDIAAAHPDRSPVLWIYDPHKGYLADNLNPDRVVYDIMDEYGEFPWSPPGIRAEEDALLRRADFTFAGTHALFESKEDRARRIKCYLSAVDWEHFSRAQLPELAPPPEAADWRERFDLLVGYFGMVDPRIDWTLVEELARRHPRWGFVFVGPQVGEAPERDNILLMGQRPYESLPQYCREWDFCWIPFLLNEWTRHINPTKMLEYFATGKPSISVRIPDVVKFYSEETLLGDTADEIEAHIEGYRANPDAHAARLERAAAAARHSGWDRLVENMLSDLAIEVKSG